MRNTFPFINNEVKFRDEESLSHFVSNLSSRRVVVDVGCGHGDFLIDRTSKDKESYFIGIEVSRKRAYKTAQRLSKRNVSNFAVINCSGDLALKVCFPECSVDEFHILFPDPWLKKHHWKNRLLKPSFIIQMIRLLKPGGRIYFATDVKEYAYHTFELLNKFDELSNVYAHPVEVNLYPEFPTLFFRKMSPLRDIHFICFGKN